ncbi:MAG: hypothetical protein ABIP64_01730 [Burkholderiales bacterium]
MCGEILKLRDSSNTREEFHNRGRITELIENGRLFTDIGLSPLDPAIDRVMICGTTSMLKDTSALVGY